MAWLGRLVAVSLLCSVGLGLAADEVGPQVAGYRRDGTGIFPGIKPPTRNMKVKWATELPSWGHSSPIAVGDRVLCVVEPVENERLWPALVCLDAKTGRILWDKPLDHLDALPANERASIRAEWTGTMKNPAGKRPSKSLQEAGCTVENWRHSFNVKRKNPKSISCIGFAYATPVSDGKLVWSVTSWGGFFCHDLDGNQKWVAFSKGNHGEYCRNGRSPLLHKGMLISDITNRVRCFDAATGRLLWTDDGPADKKFGTKQGGGWHTIISPEVLTIDGVDILHAAGGCMYELPGGKRLKTDGFASRGMQILVKHDEPNVAFFSGSGQHSGWVSSDGVLSPAAVEYARQGDTVTGKVLWHAGTIAGDDKALSKALAGGGAPHLLYNDGKLYHRAGIILDAKTGKTVRGIAMGKRKGPKAREVAVPDTHHLLLLGGGHVYGWRRAAKLSVFTANGRSVASFDIPQAEESVNHGWKKGGWVSYGFPFTLGRNAVYARGHLHLYCVVGD